MTIMLFLHRHPVLTGPFFKLSNDLFLDLSDNELWHIIRLRSAINAGTRIVVKGRKLFVPIRFTFRDGRSTKLCDNFHHEFGTFQPRGLDAGANCPGQTLGAGLEGSRRGHGRIAPERIAPTRCPPGHRTALRPRGLPNSTPRPKTDFGPHRATALVHESCAP